MKTIEVIRRSGIGVQADATITVAAKLMDDTGVGALVVLDGDAPVGIVTDRDLVRRGLARRLDPEARVDGVMSSPLVTIAADDDLHEGYRLIGASGVRRLVVTDRGRFVGMVTADDLLMNLAADLADLARPVVGESIFGHHDAPTPARV